MRYEWDDNKNRANKAKHGISFETASLVFDDPVHLSMQDRHEGGEERWRTLGLVNGVVILIVVHTFRKDDTGKEVLLIISARKATAHERKRYEQGI